MPRLHELEIYGNIKSALGFLNDLPLTRLRCTCENWRQSDFTALSKIESLENLELIYTEFNASRLAEISKLSNLKQLRMVSSKGKSITGLESLQQLPNLSHLTVCGDVSAAEMQAIAHNETLKYVSFESGSLDDVSVRQLAQNKSIGSVVFGHMQVSVDTYDALVEAGIGVEHNGITDDELSENYIQHNDIYYPIDHEKSAINAHLRPDASSVAWTIDAEAAEKPRHAWTVDYPTGLTLYEFSFDRDWRELVGQRKQIKSDDGIFDSTFTGHEGAFDHDLRFLSRNGNQFHIKWSCLVGAYSDGHRTTVDAKLNFKTLFVKDLKEISASLDKAKAVAAKFFDLHDFCEPVFSKRYFNTIEFEVKAED